MNPERLLQNFAQIADAPDAVSRLQRFILDLAVRGKLVPQDPNDEPAFELLKRIQEKKAEMVKEGKIRKQDLQADIDSTGIPFGLPERWVWARLGDVIHLVSGQHLQPGEYSDQRQSGPPYITGPADFGMKGLVITRYAVVRKAVAKKGQILLTVKGAGVGKTAICDLPEVAISRQLMAMTPIEWSQLYLLLTTHRLAEALKESARSLIPGISREDVDQFVFPLPPLAEQKRIVAKVDELMALCDELETAQQKRERRRDRLVAATLNGIGRDVSPKRPQRNGNGGFDETAPPKFFLNHLPRLTTRPEHIQQLRQTILNLAVRGKLVPQDPKDGPVRKVLDRCFLEKQNKWRDIQCAKVGGKNRKIKSGSSEKRYHEPITPNVKSLPRLPVTWEWVCWESVLAFGDESFKRGPFGSSLTKSIFVSSGYKVYEQYCPINDDCSFGRYYITPQKYKELQGFAVKAKDFLVSCSGVTLGRITQIPDEYEEGIINQALLRVRIGNELISDSFFKMLFRSPYFQRQIFNNSTGMAIPNVKGVKELKAIPLPLPPLAEQHRIVAKVDELMALCDELEARLNTNATTRRQLLEATLSEAIAS